MSSTNISTPVNTVSPATATASTPATGTTSVVPAKVEPVGTFLNIAYYFGTFFLFVFFLFMFIKVVGGGKSDK
jgi:hypothetical protein